MERKRGKRKKNTPAPQQALVLLPQDLHVLVEAHAQLLGRHLLLPLGHQPGVALAVHAQPPLAKGDDTIKEARKRRDLVLAWTHHGVVKGRVQVVQEGHVAPAQQDQVGRGGAELQGVVHGHLRQLHQAQVHPLQGRDVEGQLAGPRVALVVDVRVVVAPVHQHAAEHRGVQLGVELFGGHAGWEPAHGHAARGGPHGGVGHLQQLVWLE